MFLCFLQSNITINLITIYLLNIVQGYFNIERTESAIHVKHAWRCPGLAALSWAWKPESKANLARLARGHQGGSGKRNRAGGEWRAGQPRKGSKGLWAWSFLLFPARAALIRLLGVALPISVA